MPGLKGLRASGRGGERAVTHGLPAQHSWPSMGCHVPEQPTGLCPLRHRVFPAGAGLRCPPRRAAQRASAQALLPRQQLGAVGQKWHCQGAAWLGAAPGGLRRAPACVATSYLLTRGVCI